MYTCEPVFKKQFFIVTLFLFYKNVFYKNAEAEICPKIEEKASGSAKLLQKECTRSICSHNAGALLVIIYCLFTALTLIFERLGCQMLKA